MTRLTRPRLTLVIPAFKVQGYVRECLDSVLRQSYPDYEVLCVDDHSPDASGAIMDEFAARDSRFRVLHLPENVGLGPARNAGMAEARGDYVLFLDSDDTLAPGALAAVAARLEATGDPDVLVYDYARAYWDGRSVPNQRKDLLAHSGPDSFPLSDRPQLLDLLQIAWNKAVRRDFIERHGLRFFPGYYEDAPWTYCALITAERIAVLDRVCVMYRQRRSGGNILRTTSRKHFDVFDQYDRVFAYLDDHPELDVWRRSMFRKMVDHYLTVLDRPDRLPAEARGEFFRRAAADYRRREPNDFARPSGPRGRKYGLLARGSYPVLSGVKVLGKARRQVRRKGGETVRRARRTAVNASYGMQLRRPVDDELAVFSAYWSRAYACNPAAVDAELARLAPQIRRVWAIRPEHAHRVPEGVETVRVGSRAYWAAIARARWTVNNVNFGDTVVKRKGSIHLQTHHGTPLKSMGLDQRRYPASSHGMDFDALLRRCDRWDYSISSNRFSTAIWERVYPCSFTSLETGYPRNDVLLTSTAADVRRIRDSLGLAEGTTALLYVPTHRDHEDGFRSRLDLARFAEDLGPDVTLLVRGHYFYDPSAALSSLRADGRVVDVSKHPAVEDLYLAADALIADYSSAMFDFANLDRPIVIHADDWEVYSAVRGTYFDLLEEPPGPVATNQDQLTEIFRSGAWQDRTATGLRAEFRKRFCDFDDGHAAERVVRRVFLGEDESRLPAVVPLAERTPAPSPTRALETAGAC